MVWGDHKYNSEQKLNHLSKRDNLADSRMNMLYIWKIRTMLGANNFSNLGDILDKKLNGSLLNKTCVLGVL